MGPELRKEAEKHHIHVVIAGHISSDSVGINLFMDDLERKGVDDRPDVGLHPRASRRGLEGDRLAASSESRQGPSRSSCWRRRGGRLPCRRPCRPAPTPSTSASIAGARAPSPATSPPPSWWPPSTAPTSTARALHLALNILLKDDELDPALAALAGPYEAGLDALIVTDLGFASHGRASAIPDLELHASTQLDTHSSVQLGLLARLGFSQGDPGARAQPRRDRRPRRPRPRSRGVRPRRPLLRVLGRLPAGQHGRRAQRQPRPLQPVLPPEVHARAARRRRRASGSTARLAGGGRRRPRTAARALDRATSRPSPVLPRLIAAGVRSFKIEGRMKDPGYVAVATAVYREALDAALADPAGYRVRPEWRSRLEQSFSRGFTAAHLEGAHDRVRSGDRGGHRGLQVGRVEAVDEATGEVRLAPDHAARRRRRVQIYTPGGRTEPQRARDDAASRGEPGATTAAHASAPARARRGQGPGLPARARPRSTSWPRRRT